MRRLIDVWRATLVALGGLLISCVVLVEAAQATDGVEFVTTDSNQAKITRVEARASDVNRLRVFGHLQKRLQRRGPIPGRLYLALLDHDGNLLRERQVDYRRRSRRSGRAYYSLVFDVPAEQVHTVRVTHLGLGD